MTEIPQITVRPAREGLVVRHPGGRRLTMKGATVPSASTYWLRRIRDGDVVVVPEKTTPARTTRSARTPDRQE